jgi:hypothetical protein
MKEWDSDCSNNTLAIESLWTRASPEKVLGMEGIQLGSSTPWLRLAKRTRIPSHSPDQQSI